MDKVRLLTFLILPALLSPAFAKTVKKSKYDPIRQGTVVYYDTLFGEITKSVSRYKNWRLEGAQEEFYRNGMRLNLYRCQNGLAEDTIRSWDSLGNLTGIGCYRHNKKIGEWRLWFGPGRPREIIHYDDSGRMHGPRLEWWENGNKRLEAVMTHDQMYREKEYFPNGMPRIYARIKEEPSASPRMIKTIESESWNPSGKSTGKVVEGTGELFLFSGSPGDSISQYRVWHEIYRDSLSVSSRLLDSSASAAWLRH